MKKKRLLIIPARSGSKRIKNKNFKNFKGYPIISYSILTALKSKIFKKIVVSIDDKKFTKYLKKFRIEISYRSKKLSKDNTSTEDVLRSIIRPCHAIPRQVGEDTPHESMAIRAELFAMARRSMPVSPRVLFFADCQGNRRIAKVGH